LVTKISFETSSAIDDCTIETESGGRYLIQAKRNLSFSASLTSEFYSVIKQFVLEFINTPGSNSKFILAISPKASRNILSNVTKLADSIRANDLAFEENPLNKNEQETLDGLRALTATAFQEVAKKDITDSEFNALLSRTHCINFDIEDGGSLEQAILTVLACKVVVSPHLIWQALVSSALNYAGKRMSVTREALCNIYGHFLTTESKFDTEQKADVQELFKTIISGDIASGKEIVIVKSSDKFDHVIDYNHEDFDYMLLELLRFDDNCKKRLKFKDEYCQLANGIKLIVIYRSSTWTGAEYFIENNFDLHSKIAMLPANVKDNPDDYICAKIWSEACKTMLENATKYHNCLHCGAPISASDCFIVEIDEEDVEHQLGQVHFECRRGIDRVIGRVNSEFFEKYPLLEGFDIDAWASSIIRGQALWCNYKTNQQGSPVYVGWNPLFVYNSSAQYCIRMDLADGSSNYVTSRGKIHRLSKLEADEKAKEFNEQTLLAKKKGDFLCVTSKGRIFGTYSSLVRIKASDEACLECIEFRPVKYSTTVSQMTNEAYNFYAPLFYFIEEGQKEPFKIGDHVVLLTDPMSISNYFDNWARGGFPIGKFKPVVIKSDLEFDLFVRRNFDSECNIVVNPTIGLAGETIGGFIIKNLQEIIQDSGSKR
jgi:hypothetical protein